MAHAAVLTGDLIGSTKLGAARVDVAMDILATAAGTIGAWAGTDCAFTRFRGDGWQICLSDPKWVLRATLLMVASLRGSGVGLATRVAIGIGTVDRISSTNLADAAGQAFVLSGQGLDRMARTKRLAIAGEPDEIWAKAVIDMAEWISTGWTREQAQAVIPALGLMPWAREQEARAMGITRQAFEARLKGSGIDAMTAALAAFEGTRP